MDNLVSSDMANQGNTNFSSVSSLDENLIKAFIGKNSEVIYPKLFGNDRKFRINIYSILFGWPYFFYRKIYYPILIPLFLIFLPKQLSVYVVYFITAFNGCFYLAYKSKINKTIDEIKKTNLGKTPEELISLATKTGGVLPVWLLVVVVILYVIAFSFLYTYASTL